MCLNFLVKCWLVFEGRGFRLGQKAYGFHGVRLNQFRIAGFQELVLQVRQLFREVGWHGTEI